MGKISEDNGKSRIDERKELEERKINKEDERRRAVELYNRFG